MAGVGGTDPGGVAAALFKKDSDRTVSLLLSFASGAMLYVLFGELLPESILMFRSKLPALGVPAGILAGLVIIYV